MKHIDLFRHDQSWRLSCHLPTVLLFFQIEKPRHAPTPATGWRNEWNFYVDGCFFQLFVPSATEDNVEGINRLRSKLDSSFSNTSNKQNNITSQLQKTVMDKNPRDWQ